MVYRKNSSTTGFTIVELLIVIVVIGILAAVTIVAYNGIAQRAKEAGLQADLSNAAKRLKLDQVDLGSYPATKELANNGLGLKASAGTSYQYTSATSQTFCLTATSGTTSYFITQDGVPQVGVCVGHIDAGVVLNGDAVTTFAGSSAGSSNGTGTAAHFGNPQGMVIDSTGNTMYIADRGCHCIRAATVPGAAVTTYAGNPASPGVSNGTGTSLSGVTFNAPDAIAIDASNNLYIADYYRIRKINTTTGATITLAGANTGYVDASGATARFAGVTEIALDTSGNLYVADPNNNRIRKVTSSGTVTTFAGASSGYLDGNGTAALFSSPQGVAINSSGDIYIADTFNNRIRKITPAGNVTTFAGSTAGSNDGTGTAAKFSSPTHLAFDSNDNLYITDAGNHRIRKATPGGVVTTLMGATSGYADGTGTAALFTSPAGLFMASDNTLYIADSGNNRIRAAR